MKTKRLALVTAVICLVCLLLMPTDTQAATTVNLGSCGNGVYWLLDDEGTLSITGTGEMSGYFVSRWADLSDDIKKVVIYPGVTAICDSAFEDLNRITSVSIPEGVTAIGEWAFSGCSQLTEITLPESLETIGKYAFYGCDKLASINIPQNVTAIDASAFFCDRLKSVYITDIAAWLNISMESSWSNPLCGGCDEVDMYLNGERIVDLKIPYGVTDIPDYRFAYSTIESVTFPASIETIGNHAFYYTESLTVVYFYGDAPTIYDYAFTDYSRDIRAYYPKGNTTWTRDVFEDFGCDLYYGPKDYCASGHTWLEYNCTSLTCEICGATQPGPGHTYAHRYDYKCDLCGHERVVTMTRPMVDMYRMYDPNSGEHFYTGSLEERENLVAAGWNYEGVGFTFPLTTGDPVHRLYDPVTGEHLYTMDEAEKAMLEAQGWNYEGIAFNSGFENEVPQYRLHNPNATRGAYHFTASAEERDNLIAAGWEYQGIGWYSLGAV